MMSRRDHPAALWTRRQALAGLGSGVALASLPRVLSAQARLAGAEVKLGAAFPLTGIWSEWGKKDKVALDMAVEEINAAGGVGGVPVRYAIYDTASKPPDAAALVRRLASDDKVLAILGPFSSSECEVAFPVGVQLKIPMIAQASSKPGIGAANRPWAFRMNVDEGRMAQPAVKFWVKHYSVKTAAVVHDVKDAVGQILGSRVLPAVAKQNGVALVNEGDFVTFQTKDIDFSPQVTKLRGLRFDGLIFGGAFPDAINFVKEARRQGLRQPIVGGNPLMHENFARNTGEAGEGVVAPTPWNPSLPDERVQAFVRKFAERAQAAGLPPTPEMVNVNVYETVSLLKDIVERKGATNRPEDLARDRERIMQGLTETASFPGLAGKFGFNQEGDGVKDVYVMMVKNGRWAQVDFAPAQAR
ncbi:MAG TPA: ABC transporter substrate-binding protein [Methylomirabilota bacterium]|jgi:branched-chain amino acid transport system substrate-binding protein|nr:ABC transporter substrate-binding protein [Methylomirabilota bacterium]